ncbi:MAG: hypothetical protein LUG65_02235, partial [Clostridiales bacterium]|nr:hypothetical protein [Clostridiales bacterium]
MGSFSREFTIRQVTPIIHFQFDEAGATLRATELKPKLDRFLCGRYRAEQGKTVPKAWQIVDAPGNDGRSGYYHLNYKAQVFVNGTPEIIPENHTYLKFNRKTGQEIEKVDRHFPMYFGNMGNDDAKAPKESGENKRGDKHGVFCPEGLTLKITCLISDKARREALLTFIGDNLELFFLTHNFGTRQTKGYGGFLYFSEHPLGKQLALLQKVYPRFIYFQLNSTIQHDKTPAFESAKNPPEWVVKTDLISMAMKTGRNLRTKKDIDNGIEDN